MSRKPTKVDYQKSIPGWRMDAVEIQQEDTGRALVRRPVVGIGDSETHHTARVSDEGALSIESPELLALQQIREELRWIRWHLNQLTEAEELDI